MMNKAICIFMGVFLLAVILVRSAFAQYMPPSGGSESNIYSGAKNVYYKDGDLDTRIKNLTARMRNGSVTYQESEGRLSSYYDEARMRLAHWRDNYSVSQAPSLYQAVDNMLSLQVQRCWELIDATKYEHSHGYGAAKSRWDAEISTYNRYESAVKKVKSLL